MRAEKNTSPLMKVSFILEDQAEIGRKNTDGGFEDIADHVTDAQDVPEQHEVDRCSHSQVEGCLFCEVQLPLRYVAKLLHELQVHLYI